MPITKAAPIERPEISLLLRLRSSAGGKGFRAFGRLTSQPVSELPEAAKIAATVQAFLGGFFHNISATCFLSRSLLKVALEARRGDLPRVLVPTQQKGSSVFGASFQFGPPRDGRKVKRLMTLYDASLRLRLEAP